AENKALLEKEMASIETKAKRSIRKITRAQIQAHMQAQIEKLYKVIENLKTGSRIVNADPLVENVNRLMSDTYVATTVDQAIAILNLDRDKVGRHPERLIEGAYKAFEAENLPRIKAENPSMRMSQRIDMLHRDWI
ncbi:Coiled-coil domain-containing protein 124, partial [Pseudolycoriella hygida]